jgi:hypothetical protein
MTTQGYDLQETGDDEQLYCANHPKEPTYLRCGRCDKPICAKCRIHTPVGFRCFDCANVQVLPTYAISTDFYVKAALFGAVAAAVAGVLMGIFPGFEFWAAMLMGIAVPEAVTAAANQKRGPGLQMIGMGAVVFGFVVSRFVLGTFPDLLPLNGINEPIASNFPFGDAPYYVSQYTIVWLALALFLANRRLR